MAKVSPSHGAVAKMGLDTFVSFPFTRRSLQSFRYFFFPFLFLNISLKPSEMLNSMVPKLAVRWNKLGIFKNY